MATAGCVTVTVAVPVLPSLVAVIVALPGATPVTTPVEGETVAIFVALELHVTVRPVSTFPAASLIVAVYVVVWPTGTLAVDGVTVTVATGTSVTVTVAVPLFPSLVAVIVAVPAADPVTTPLVEVPETVAIMGLLVLQETARPVSTLPLASFIVAVSVVVCPTLTVAVDGEIVTVVTGVSGAVVTVTVAVPLLPSLLAVIVTVPAATPVTTPSDTVAMPVLLDAQVTRRPVRTVPFASFTVAVSVVD